MRKCDLNLCIHMTSKRKLMLGLHSDSKIENKSKSFAPQNKLLLV